MKDYSIHSFPFCAYEIWDLSIEFYFQDFFQKLNIYGLCDILMGFSMEKKSRLIFSEKSHFVAVHCGVGYLFFLQLSIKSKDIVKILRWIPMSFLINFLCIKIVDCC